MGHDSAIFSSAKVSYPLLSLLPCFAFCHLAVTILESHARLLLHDIVRLLVVLFLWPQYTTFMDRASGDWAEIWGDRTSSLYTIIYNKNKLSYASIG